MLDNTELEYISRSTIDREPRESEPKQQKLIQDNKKEADAILSCDVPNKFEFKLILSLKPARSNAPATQLPIIVGTAKGDRIEELVTKSISAAYFIQRLRGVVGEPLKFEDEGI